VRQGVFYVDNVDWMRIAKKVGDCPRALRGEIGFVDNVDNVYLKIIRYHIYCIDIQWCISTLLSGANLKLWSKVPTLSTTHPRQKAPARACGSCGQFSFAWSTLSTCAGHVAACIVPTVVDQSTLSTSACLPACLCGVSAHTPGCK